jgi:hypothetical protein
MQFKKNYTYTSDFQKAMVGGFGHDFLVAADGTSPVGVFFQFLEAWEDSVISYQSIPEPSDMNGQAHESVVTSRSFTKGQAISGRITEVTVVSGEVIAYLG